MPLSMLVSDWPESEAWGWGHFVTLGLVGVPTMGGRHLAPERLPVASVDGLLAPLEPRVAATWAHPLLKH